MCAQTLQTASALPLLRYSQVATKIRRWLAQFLDHILLHGFWN